MPTPGDEWGDVRSRVGLFVVEEIARVVAIWASKGWPETTLGTLRHWAGLETAALSPRVPSPEPALKLMVRAGLIEVTPDGLARPCDELLVSDEERTSVDRFARPVALAVFQRLLALPEFEREFSGVFADLRLTAAQPAVAWSSIPAISQKNPAWIWLQQLGLGEHQEGDFVADAMFIPFLLDVDVSKKHVSQAELDKRLQLRRMRSELAEDYVVALECERLRQAGVGFYAEGVVRVSLDDVSAGYDIRSFEIDGRPRHIEVKSSAGRREQFFISRNEIALARAERDRYWLVWLGWASRLPRGPCEVAWFRDPVEILDASPSSPWMLEEVSTLVTRVGSDEADQSRP